MKEYPEAVAAASQVLEAHPHVYEAFQTRAKAHHAAGNLEAAYADLTAAVRLAPQNRDLHRDLLSVKEEIQCPADPLPDSMFQDSKDSMFQDSIKDRDSGGSTSSGVGSSL